MGVRLPRAPRGAVERVLEHPHLAEPLPEEKDWARLLCTAADSPYPCRDRAILHLFWWLALTVHDVLALRAEDVDFLCGRIRWGEGRQGLLPPEALRVLAAYASMERDPRCTRLFGGRHGRPLSRAQIASLFARLSAASGVPVSPHALRMAAIYRLLRGNPLHAFTTLRPHREEVRASRAAE